MLRPEGFNSLEGYSGGEPEPEAAWPHSVQADDTTQRSAEPVSALRESGYVYMGVRGMTDRGRGACGCCRSGRRRCTFCRLIQPYFRQDAMLKSYAHILDILERCESRLLRALAAIAGQSAPAVEGQLERFSLQLEW